MLAKATAVERSSPFKSVWLGCSFVPKHGGMDGACVNNKPRGIYSASLANVVLTCFDDPGSHVRADFQQGRGVGTNFYHSPFGSSRACWTQ